MKEVEMNEPIKLQDWCPVAVGDVVMYVDETGRHHAALVTIVHGPQSEEEVRANYQAAVDSGYTPYYTADQAVEAWRVPCINVVYLSDDPKKSDPYGRQIERASSVAHQSMTTAQGRFYRTAQQ